MATPRFKFFRLHIPRVSSPGGPVRPLHRWRSPPRAEEHEEKTRRPMTSTITTAGSDSARFDADRQAIRDVRADVYQAWAAGDAEAFVADYTEDATVVQPGVYKKDREEIRT